MITHLSHYLIPLNKSHFFSGEALVNLFQKLLYTSIILFCLSCITHVYNETSTFGNKTLALVRAFWTTPSILWIEG